MMHLSRLGAITQSIKELNRIIAHANKYLDNVICKEVEWQKKRVAEGKEPYFPNYVCLQHMYNCALQKRSLTGKTKEAYEYLAKLLKLDIFDQTIREKAISALILEYLGEHHQALLYADSLYQYTNYEISKGRWFDTPRASYSWMSYKIPTHVLGMEALFALRPNDSNTIEQMKTWLLQEKRTQLWETPIDCVNAVHALMLGNETFKTHSLSRTFGVDIYADNKQIETERVEQGVSLHATLSADVRTMVFDKHSKGLSWGCITADFMQPLQDVQANESGMVLKREILADTQNLHVGDRIRVRLTCECSRNFDMVEIHDVRAACMEPVNQLTSSDSFVHISPQDTKTVYSYLGLGIGTHVIETEYFLDRPGTYQLGLATALCCYAPEFRSTSSSEKIVVRACK